MSIREAQSTQELDLRQSARELRGADKPRKFTTDWFSHNIPNWEKWLAAFKGKETQGVEIGCWEGRATCWLMDNILTHPGALLTVMDTFGGGAEHSTSQVGDLEARFDFNTAGYAPKICKEKGPSHASLAKLAVEGFPVDFIYIDGSHIARHVLTDAALAWTCLKVGGVLIFDDYHWARAKEAHNRPHMAIDAFLAIYVGQYSLLHKGHQVAVRKIANFD